MSDGNQPGAQDVIGRYLAPGGDNVKLVYVLYLASILVGLTALIGLVIAYVNRPQVAGTWMEGHYTYQIRTFWIGLLFSFVAVLLVVIGIGVLLFIALAIWAIVRCIKGLQWASAGQPVPNPQSWTV
jgi:uncharacterized membrane protein